LDFLLGGRKRPASAQSQGKHSECTTRSCSNPQVLQSSTCQVPSHGGVSGFRLGMGMSLLGWAKINIKSGRVLVKRVPSLGVMMSFGSAALRHRQGSHHLPGYRQPYHVPESPRHQEQAQPPISCQQVFNHLSCILNMAAGIVHTSSSPDHEGTLLDVEVSVCDPCTLFSPTPEAPPSQKTRSHPNWTDSNSNIKHRALSIEPIRRMAGAMQLAPTGLAMLWTCPMAHGKEVCP
jgi:hypothetical protein